MSDLDEFSKEEVFDECTWNDMTEELGDHSTVYKEPIDEEQEELVNGILKKNALIEKLKQLPKYKEYKPYYHYPYDEKSLYQYTKTELKKILRNLENRILSLIWHFGYRPSYRPSFYSNIPEKFDRYPFNNPLYALYHKWVAPTRILSQILPPFKTEVTLSEADLEYLCFTLTNMEFLSELATIRMQGMLQDGNLKEIDLIGILRRSLSNPRIPDEERKLIQDEILRWELGKKTPKQRRQLTEIYQKYAEIMAARRRDYENQQQQLLTDGLRRREELAQLQKAENIYEIRKKETLGIDSAEAIIRTLSTQAKKKKRSRSSRMEQ